MVHSWRVASNFSDVKEKKVSVNDRKMTPFHASLMWLRIGREVTPLRATYNETITSNNNVSGYEN